MTPHDIVRAAIPSADEDLCAHIIWGRTGFPMFWKTNNPAREIYQAARRFWRAEANGRQLCDHCDNEVADGIYVCLPCGTALGRACS